MREAVDERTRLMTKILQTKLREQGQLMLQTRGVFATLKLGYIVFGVALNTPSLPDPFPLEESMGEEGVFLRAVLGIYGERKMFLIAVLVKTFVTPQCEFRVLSPT